MKDKTEKWEIENENLQKLSVGTYLIISKILDFTNCISLKSSINL